MFTRFSTFRCLWIVLTLSSFTSFGFCATTVLLRLLNPGFKTEVTAELPDTLDFPAVTICNLNQYRQSYLRKSRMFRSVLLKLYGNATISQFSRYYKDIEFEASPTTNLSNENITQLFREAGHEISSMLSMFTYSGVMQYELPPEYFRSGFTEFGLCHTFNWDTESPLIVARPGAKYGFWTLVNIQQYDYFLSESVGLGAGIRVSVCYLSLHLPKLPVCGSEKLN